MEPLRVGLIGYGEVGRIFTFAFVDKGAAWVGAWDILFNDTHQSPGMTAHCHSAGVEACLSSADLVSRADVVICAVTASSSLAAAEEAARSIRPGTFYLDLNSASPETKQRSSVVINAAGAHYVEAGVMTSVPPYGIGVPMVLGGARAAELAARLAPWGLDTEVVSENIGVASAIKMCRSVMIKGMEALVIESFTTARRYGVEDRVLASLHETFPHMDWERTGAYFFSRVVKHGKRRAEEMREAARTVNEAGFEPLMTAAIAEKQAWVASLAATGLFKDVDSDADWRDYADRIKRDPHA
jgi:3-hydroxyisobutyrate dehydrogenase-like beta-hydroxyacid dehydrogenase